MGAVICFCCPWNHHADERALLRSLEGPSSGVQRIRGSGVSVAKRSSKTDDTSESEEESSDDGIDYAAEAAEMAKNFKLVATVGYNEKKMQANSGQI